MALQPQASGPSKILAAGSAVVSNSYDFAMARYNADGSLDTTFGNKGKVTTAFSGNWSVNSMVVDGAGRILVAGVPDGGTSGNLTLVRYTANGALDTTFGSGGKLVTPLNVGDPQMAVQPDGKMQFDAEKVRVRQDGMVKAALGSGPLALLVRGGSHVLSESVRRLRDGQCEYMHVATRRYQQFSGEKE